MTDIWTEATTEALTLVVDSTVFRRTSYLNSNDWRRLTALAGQGELSVVIPGVVALEIERQHREAWASASKKIRDGRDDSLRLMSQAGLADLELPTADEAWADFSERLRAPGLRVAGWPSVDHEALVGRDLAKRKPFNETGKGYRDALIWHTVLEIAAEAAGQRLCFVSGNTSDFTHDDELHPDLGADLHAGAVELTWYPTVKAFLQAEAPSRVELAIRMHGQGSTAAMDEEAALSRPSIDELLVDHVADHIENLVLNSYIDEATEEQWGTVPRSELRIPNEFTDVKIEDVEVRKEMLRTSIVEVYDGADSLINGDVEALLQLDGFVSKADYYALTDEESDGLSVWDSDWNEHVMWVKAERTVRFDFSALVNTETEDVQDLTLTGVLSTQPTPSH